MALYPGDDASPMTTIESARERVRTREDLVAFLAELRRHLRENRAAWENDSLEAYLEAFQAVLTDWDGRFENRGESVPEDPTWKLIAELLLAATMYE